MDPKLRNQLVISWHDIRFIYVSNENEVCFYYDWDDGDVTKSGKLTFNYLGEVYLDNNITLANCAVKLPECRTTYDEFSPDYGSGMP